MIVIIPHPDDELKIVKIQNKLIQKLSSISNNGKNIFFKHFPLWIPMTQLNESHCLDPENSTCKKTQLKELSKIIKKITLGRFIYNNNQVIMEVTIYTEKENLSDKFHEKMILLQTPMNNKYKKDDIKNIENILNNCNEKDDERLLRIFRLGTLHQISDNSFSISDSIWCKLK